MPTCTHLHPSWTCRDETGAQDQPWADWTRQWTAEENRHGDLLNKYLYLCGKVDMRQIEVRGGQVDMRQIEVRGGQRRQG